jgi:putative polyketide hydroxylase
LAQQGVRVTVVERHASTSIHPKARNLSIRTMELFGAAGIDEAVRAAGDNRGAVGIGDTLAGESNRVFRPFDTFDPPGQSPVIRAFCEQTKLEPIVRRRAEQLGATMLFGYAAVRITQNGDSVTVDIARPDGTAEAPIVARYVIVADGANAPPGNSLRVPEPVNW